MPFAMLLKRKGNKTMKNHQKKTQKTHIKKDRQKKLDLQQKHDHSFR